MKKLRRGITICLILGILGIIALLGLDGFVKLRTAGDIHTLEELQNKELQNEGKNEDAKADAIIVLGAQVKKDGSLSKMLKERVDTGIALYQAGISDRILMTGDHGKKSYDEVNAMKTYAIEQGIPSEAIFMDHAGFSTYDSMCRAKNVFEIERAVVVTQEYHLYRALYDAQAFGIDADGASCDTRVYRGDRYRKLREILARVKDVGYAAVKPEPKYLGDPIPISGNGDDTNDVNE